MEFQTIVVVIAIIVLIAALVFIGVALSKASDKKTWPPVTPSCPDYWTTDASGSCVNVKDLGNNKGTCAKPASGHLTVNFNEGIYIGDRGSCAKSTWATDCNIAWDGITYGVKNPCN